MSDLDQLAKLVGAVPTFRSDNPEAALQLLARIEGDKGYRSRLLKAAKDLYQLLQQADPAALSKKPKPADLDALQHLLHSLSHVASKPVARRGYRLRYVAIPRRAGDFVAGKEYGHLSRTSFTRLVDALAAYHPEQADRPWLNVVPAYKNHETGEGRRTRIQATRPFLDWLVQRELVFPWHPHRATADQAKSKASTSLLWVSQESPDDSGEQDKPSPARPLDRPLQEDEEILPTLNAALHKQRLLCPLDSYAEYEQLYDFTAGRPKHSLGGNRQLHRQFALEDGRAGRLYGHWVQPLPSRLRRKLTINGQPAVELDYTNMQLVLLYALRRLPTPSQGDLYVIPGTSHARDDMKLVLTRSVGTATRQDAIASIHNTLRQEGRPGMDRARTFYDDFWGYHAAACPHTEDQPEAPWPQLQNLDSRIALRVLRKLLDQGITAIPIHDSFIVQERHADTTQQVMHEAFAELCPGIPVRVKRT